MRSAKSCFSGALFCKNLRRFWPLWAMYLAVWLLALPLPMLRGLSVSMRETSGMVSAATGQVLESALSAGAIIVFVFAIAAAMAVWGFLYGTRSSNAMGALPVRREGLFFSAAASALGPMLAVHVLTFLIALAVEAGSGCLQAGYLLQWLAIVTMELLLFFGLASFCAMLTGHIVALPVVYGIVSFAAVVAERVFHHILRSFIYGLPTAFDPVLTPLSPLVQILSGLQVSYTRDDRGLLTDVAFSGWGVLLLYCAAGLLLLGGAFLLLRRRRLETAGDVIAIRALRPVFKYCFAVGCALVLGWLFRYLIFSGTETGGPGMAAAMTVLILIGCFLGYFSATMLLKKSFHAFAQWRGFAVTAAVLLALCLCCELDLTGYERRVPDTESVSRAWIGSEVEVSAEENLEAVAALHQCLIAEKKDFEQTEYGRWIDLSYELEDGSAFRRHYVLPADYETPIDQQSEALQQYQALLNCREAVFNRTLPQVAVTEDSVSWANISWMDEHGVWDDLTLTAAQAVELWERCILPDLEDGTIGQSWLVDTDTRLGCDIYLELTDRSAPAYTPGAALLWNYGSVSLSPQPESRRTLAFLSELGITPASYGALDTETDA